MAEFYTWVEALAPKVLPEGRFGKAVHYALGQWPKLAVFLTHGEVPLTNNRCENGTIGLPNGPGKRQSAAKWPSGGAYRDLPRAAGNVR